MHPLLERILAGETPDLSAFFEAFGERISLLHELHNTPQDPEWHAEGNVGIHTQMVLEQTYGWLEQPTQADLTAQERLILILGAVFHDIAKPLTTRTAEINDKERIVAPHHAAQGRSYLAYRLMEWGLPYAVVRDTLALVGHHHDPKKLIKKERSEAAYLRLARLAPMDLLYHLEQADIRGRICPDLPSQLEILELFQMFSQEYGVWRQAPHTLTEWREQIHQTLSDMHPVFRDLAHAAAILDREAGLIHTPEEAIARSYRYRDGFARLVVLCGPSGTGKTTWVERNLPSQYQSISLDQIREEISGDPTDQSDNSRVRQVARERLKPLLQHHQYIVWDATNLRKDFRQAIIQLGYDYGALVTLVVLHPTERECFVRNQQRQRVVPTKILQRQLEYTEWPDEDEAHRTLFFSPNGELLHSNVPMYPEFFQ